MQIGPITVLRERGQPTFARLKNFKTVPRFSPQRSFRCKNACVHPCTLYRCNIRQFTIIRYTHPSTCYTTHTYSIDSGFPNREKSLTFVIFLPCVRKCVVWEFLTDRLLLKTHAWVHVNESYSVKISWSLKATLLPLNFHQQQKSIINSMGLGYFIWFSITTLRN